MRRTLPSNLRLLRRWLLLGFLLTPVMAVGQDPFFQAALRSAEEGDADAQYNLGLMYAIGEGVPVDDAEAVKWYRLAADQVSNRIINEIPSISRVTYDIPIKPPATIERE